MAKRKPQEIEGTEEVNLPDTVVDTSGHITPTGMTDHVAAASIRREDKVIKRTDWMTVDGYEMRFTRIPPMIFNQAIAEVRRRLRTNKPVPPMVRRSGKEMVNKADPFYKERLERWTQEWNDVSDSSNQNVLILWGMELRQAVPPVEDWLDELFSYYFEPMGYENIDDLLDSMGYTRIQMIKLFYFKYVVLMDANLLERLAAFQIGEISEAELTAEYAVDVFQPDEGSETAL